MTNTDLFARLASGHKPDCMLSLEGPLPELVPDPGQLAITLGCDATGRYAAACRPIYEDLRRIVGQLSGLLILARLTSKSEMEDLDELKKCRERWQNASEHLAALIAPPGLEKHRTQLQSAHGFCGLVMRTFPDLRAQTDNTERLDHMSIQIKRAYAHLEHASSAKAGLEMVDFSHACCSCSH